MFGEFIDPNDSRCIYDEKGNPKKYVPTYWDNKFGWMFSLNIEKDPLKGKELKEHLNSLGIQSD